jgi:hypothetical protein
MWFLMVSRLDERYSVSLVVAKLSIRVWRQDMGGNRTGVWNRILLYVVLLACLSIAACASPEVPKANVTVLTAPPQGAREHLVGGQMALARHNYQTSLQEFEAALSMSGNMPPGDEALLHMGMVYIDPGNPKRDYPKSITYFQRLVKEYPHSNWAGWARIWAETLREQDSLKRVVSQTLEENERVKRLWSDALQENERLKRLSSETAQENQTLKRLSKETAQENQKLKQTAEQLKAVDVEIDEKKKDRGQ